ncbi:NAD-dependent protein deacylase SRT2 isoform X3 [Physcomitrium patens]|uniref:NAD-dependent protein deacylase SRT2 isoform X3 n=1 Tax=Physcomitrium patens TaxID=3218 RepID=UPI000D170195|nr:NAD-dependent protein deacylase SRT2-like isoform X3 [Physcomitrium patens]|eukprot:XP_024398720.1 NAD-dependent protein deacylase SRT2-like isoform X3 [Physcomitrella patens]
MPSMQMTAISTWCALGLRTAMTGAMKSQAVEGGIHVHSKILCSHLVHGARNKLSPCLLNSTRFCNYATLAATGSVAVPQEISSSLNSIVPDSPPPSQSDLQRLYDFVNDSKRLVVITGAGTSTECGIPDYRSPHGAYSSGFKPMTHQDFISSEQNRRRYWARSYAGWRRFISANPGPTYLSLAQLEAKGRVKGMITQNVDRLHYKAGSKPIELHGTTHEVICLDCGDMSDRYLFQNRVKKLNPEWAKAVEALESGQPGSDASFGMRIRPDGDLDIHEKFFRKGNFIIPECKKCNGTLKPNVVFFGDNVPKPRVDLCMSLARSADALLVVGSSVMTMSALRLVRAAADMGSPIAILNIGPTRADDLAHFKINARSGEVLPRLLNMGSMSVPTS